MNTFEVDKDLAERIRKKYKNFTFNGTQFELGPLKIQIQSRIYKEFLNISENDAENVFKILCVRFLETLDKYQIPGNPVNIVILTDDEISRGLQVVAQMEDDKSLWGYIFIPQIDLKLVYGFWNYTFMHELSHCWVNAQFEDLAIREIFSDLVAICALREIIPAHKRLYKDVVNSRSYIGGPEGKKYFGKENHKYVLQNPESFLRDLMRSWKT